MSDICPPEFENYTCYAFEMYKLNTQNKYIGGAPTLYNHNCNYEVNDVYDVTRESLMKNNKKPLTDRLAEMAGTLSVCKEFLIETISQLDHELKSSQILLYKQLI